MWCARHIIQGEAFAVLPADDFILSEKSCLQQMLKENDQQPGNYVATMDIRDDEVSQYGIVGTVGASTSKRVTSLKEKPKPENTKSRTAIVGRYILEPGIIPVLENQAVGKSGEIQLTDSIAAMLKSTPIFAFNFSGTRFDCGSKAGFVRANLAMAKKKAY